MTDPTYVLSPIHRPSQRDNLTCTQLNRAVPAADHPARLRRQACDILQVPLVFDQYLGKKYA